MPEIIGKDGRVLQRSRNLRGIRRAVGEVLVSTVAVRRIDRPGWSGAGELSIRFADSPHGNPYDGASFRMEWASYSVLVDFVRRWRNLYGAALIVNGVPAGVVGKDNPPPVD